MSIAVCAVIVSYNPNDVLLENVTALAPQVAEIIVVDNGSAVGSADLLRLIDERPGCQVIRNGENLGIAVALNIGIQQALAGDYPWIATFDQDSLVSEGYISNMFLALERCPFRDMVALVGPRYQDPETGIISSYGPRHGSTEAPFTEIDHTMTSGNLLRGEAFSRVGFFASEFFMDCVDHEFCLRLRRNGYRLVEAGSVLLQHRLGHMTLHSMFGRSFKAFNHSPLRRYYNARNRIVIYRRYYMRFPGWIFRDICNLYRELAGIVLFEENAAAKLAAICKGIYHGLTGRMGKADGS